MATIEQEALDVLACEFALRPKGAATIDDVRPFILRSERSDSELTVEFDGDGLDAVAEFVAAEQRCCADLSWTLERAPVVRLTIGGTPAQIDVMAQILARP